MSRLCLNVIQVLTDKRSYLVSKPSDVQDTQHEHSQSKNINNKPLSDEQSCNEKIPNKEDGLVTKDKTPFKDLELSPPIQKALDDMGFEYCSPIQSSSLPHSLSGHDVLGKAQTGTGKTAAFLVALYEDLIKNGEPGERYAGEARSLIIAPTRELVIQIAEDAKKIGKYTPFNIHTLVGGMDYGKQRDRLYRSHVDVLVATPGRLIDFCEKREVFLDQIEMLVIDEADRMLDMGFIPQVKRIVRMTPKPETRQTLLFSATFSEDVLRLAEQWTVDPSRIEIEPETVATENVEQKVYMVSGDEKLVLLGNILDKPDVESIMVFANRRDQCRKVFEQLRRKGFKVGMLSGEIAQGKRVQTLNQFKQGKIQAIVATDVAGRGIHIDGVTHVVNYNLPEEPEDYVHRIGRTGRAGKNGVSISFACEDDAFRLPAIEQLLGSKIKSEVPPEEMFR